VQVRPAEHLSQWQEHHREMRRATTQISTENAFRK
jgi:hypothetical protein